MADAAQEAAALMIAEDAAPQEGEQPETQETPTEEVVEPLPAFVADTTGIEDLLGEEEEPEVDPYEAIVQEASPVEIGEYDDPETQQLKQRLAAAERQIAHEKNLRAQNESKRWQEEAARRFPLADVDVIKATSRRSFLREAAASHERYERKLGPTLDELDRYKATLVEEAKQEGREQAEAAWGKPMSGPQVPTVTASEVEQKLDRKNFKNPLDMIRARMANGMEI